LKDAETNGIAPKDGVIVKGDDAKAFADVQKYMADNKLSLKDVLENAKATPELKMKVEKIESLKIVGEAAEDEGWDSEVLAEVLESKGFEIARRDVRRVDEDTGKKVVESVWHTRKAGDDKGEWTPLAEHAEEHWKLFIPALVAGVGTDDDEAEANAAQDGATRAKRQGAQRDEGTRFVEQSRSRTPPEGKAKDTKALREEAINSGIYNTL
jgi:hypothetical protein